MRLLRVRGTLAPGGVAIVGSRTPPEAAARFAYELARRGGETVVSGLAPGIDASAHRGALDAGLATVAFVGYGAGCDDGPESAALERAILAAGGGIATYRLGGAQATPRSRIARDRLQAEHARAVVLVCSEAGGGAMFTMRFARALRKPRFAVVPPEVSAPWDGNVRALAEGAIPLPFDAGKAVRIIHERLSYSDR